MAKETSRRKMALVIIQSEGTFNVGILLTKINYDMWSQIMKIYLVERENFSYIWE